MNTKIRVLIIEDDKLYAETLKKGLERYNFDVVLEHDYNAARNLLVGRTYHPYSVVLIDVRLRDNTDSNDFSGIELAKEIELNIPVLMLSQHDTTEYIREALAVGSDGRRPAFNYILKDKGFDAIAAAIYHVTPIADAVTAKVSELDERLRANHLAITSQSAKTFFDSRIIAWSGITIIVITLLLLFIGHLDSAQGAIGAISGFFLQAIIMLFFSRQDKADMRMDRYHQEIAAMHRLELLIAISEKLPNQKSRQSVQEHILRQASQYWLAFPPPINSVDRHADTEATNAR